MRGALFHFMLALLLTFSFAVGGMHVGAADAPIQANTAEVSMSDCHSMDIQNDITPENSPQKSVAHDCVNCLGCACGALLPVLAGSTLLLPVIADRALEAPLAGHALAVDLQPPRSLLV